MKLLLEVKWTLEGEASYFHCVFLLFWSLSLSFKAALSLLDGLGDISPDVVESVHLEAVKYIIEYRVHTGQLSKCFPA